MSTEKTKIIRITKIPKVPSGIVREPGFRLNLLPERPKETKEKTEKVPKQDDPLSRLPIDVLMELYLYLDDIDLARACRTNKTINRRICQNNIFWFNRIMSKFPELSVEDIRENLGNYENYKQYYIDLTNILKKNNINQILIENAEKTNRTDLTKIALALGAEYDLDYYYPLRIASDNGNMNVVKLILEKGVDLEERLGDAEDAGTIVGEALIGAGIGGHIDIVKLLLKYGADIHTNNDEAVRWASKTGQYDVVRLLLEKGADIHAQEDGALIWAYDGDHSDVVKLLLANGADPKALEE